MTGENLLGKIDELYSKPLLELIRQASTVHQENWPAHQIQVNSLLSIKTGGCPEDCAYCPQSARYKTSIKATPMMSEEEILDHARKAKEGGCGRVCLGAAWREVKDNAEFDRVLSAVSKIRAMDLEVCCTLGMLNEDQAKKLKKAGLYAYNHNVDTSGEYYNDIITTRKYDDRLSTLENVRKAGIQVCCGGILGLGETDEDRKRFLHTLASMKPAPESVPINALVPVEGTPLANQQRVTAWEMIRVIAIARILLPKSMIRLTAGRLEMSFAEQTLCFLAGANSIFAGDKLLTTPNPEKSDDQELFNILGIEAMPSHYQNKEVMEQC